MPMLMLMLWLKRFYGVLEVETRCTDHNSTGVVVEHHLFLYLVHIRCSLFLFLFYYFFLLLFYLCMLSSSALYSLLDSL